MALHVFIHFFIDHFVHMWYYSSLTTQIFNDFQFSVKFDGTKICGFKPCKLHDLTSVEGWTYSKFFYGPQSGSWVVKGRVEQSNLIFFFVCFQPLLHRCGNGIKDPGEECDCGTEEVWFFYLSCCVSVFKTYA